MQQEINLYLALPRVEKKFLTFETITMIYGLFLLVLFLSYVYQLTGRSRQLDQLATLNVQLTEAKKQLEMTIAKYPLINPDDITGSVNRLQADISLKKELITALSEPTRFSAYLTTIGSADINGLWLSDIIFLKNGSEIQLKGIALREENIHRYYDSLKAQSLFSNMEFELQGVTLQTENKDSTKNINFEIKGKEIVS